MKKAKRFDFSRARRVTREETAMFRKAIEKTFRVKRPARGRPAKGAGKYRDVHMRMHPRALAWARAEAQRRGIGYQTVINETLLGHAG